jgi:GT2 family glycosyltransferase
MVSGMESHIAPTPWLSLVVLSFKKFDSTTGPCLDSLRDADADPEVEIVLVDNGSDDGSAAQCAERATARPALRYLPQASNLGFAGGMNAGVSAARGDWVCLVNSDTLFPQGALAALKNTLAAAPQRVAMLGPVTNAAGNGQRLLLPGEDPRSSVLSVGEAAMHQPTGLLTPTYRTDFFCVAVRRQVWDQLGGLDRAFGLGYYEDFDFSLRLRQAGWQQVIAEDVFIAHLGSATFNEMGSVQRELLRKNRQLMKQRHPAVHFDHVRLGNAQALQYLLEQAQIRGWSDSLRQRAAWRLAALDADEPRSPLKRWRWRWAQRKLRSVLRAAGIAAHFPTSPTAAGIAAPKLTSDAP